MGFAATTPAGVTVNKTTGATADTSFVVNDTSQGKNLKQRITATIASTPAGISATVGTSCGSGPVFVDTTPGSGNQTFCVRVTSSASAVSGTVTLSLSGAQRPSGWTTSTITRSFTVTVNPVAAPSAPTLTSCSVRKSGGHRFVTLNWTNVTGVVYTVLIRNTSTPVVATNDLEFAQGFLPNDVELVVRATQSGMSATSTAYFDIKFNSGSCSVVTP